MSRRRAGGESSIYQDESGRWHGWVSMGRTDNGRRDRRHRTARSRREVVAKVRELERARDAGHVEATRDTLTVGAWLEHWLESIAVRRVRPSTLQGYRSMVRTRIVPLLGHHRLDKLRPEHVEAAWARLTAQGLAPASVLQTHRVLSRALTVAEQRGRVVRNVATLIDAPSARNEEVRPLTPDEVRAVLAAAAGGRNAARWSVALALGLRQGEALGLAWQAVDLEASTLVVRRALQRQAGRGLVFVEPKSRAGRRTVAVPPQLAASLRSHRAGQAQERLAAGAQWEEDHDLVFAQRNGRPIDPRRDWADWKALLAAAGVRDARLHDARHTAATLLLTQGVPARVVMELLGHSQIGLTLGTYSHVSPELAREAAERIGEALWPTDPGTGPASSSRAPS